MRASTGSGKGACTALIQSQQEDVRQRRRLNHHGMPILEFAVVLWPAALQQALRAQSNGILLTARLTDREKSYTFCHSRLTIRIRRKVHMNHQSPNSIPRGINHGLVSPGTGKRRLIVRDLVTRHYKALIVTVHLFMPGIRDDLRLSGVKSLL